MGQFEWIMSAAGAIFIFLLSRSIAGYFGRLNTLLMDLKDNSHDHGGKELMLVDDCRQNHVSMEAMIRDLEGKMFHRFNDLKERITNLKIEALEAKAWDGKNRRKG